VRVRWIVCLFVLLFTANHVFDDEPLAVWCVLMIVLFCFFSFSLFLHGVHVGPMLNTFESAQEARGRLCFCILYFYFVFCICVVFWRLNGNKMWLMLVQVGWSVVWSDLSLLPAVWSLERPAGTARRALRPRDGCVLIIIIVTESESRRFVIFVL